MRSASRASGGPASTAEAHAAGAPEGRARDGGGRLHVVLALGRLQDRDWAARSAASLQSTPSRSSRARRTRFGMSSGGVEPAGSGRRRTRGRRPRRCASRCTARGIGRASMIAGSAASMKRRRVRRIDRPAADRSSAPSCRRPAAAARRRAPPRPARTRAPSMCSRAPAGGRRGPCARGCARAEAARRRRRRSCRERSGRGLRPRRSRLRSVRRARRRRRRGPARAAWRRAGTGRARGRGPRPRGRSPRSAR